MMNTVESNMLNSTRSKDDYDTVNPCQKTTQMHLKAICNTNHENSLPDLRDKKTKKI